MQGKWVEEQARTTRLEAELKHGHAESVKDKLCILSMRHERDELMTAEAKYTERARVLETSNNENKQMIRDVVSRVDDICKQVDTSNNENKQTILDVVSRLDDICKQVETSNNENKQMIRDVVSRVDDKLETFGAIVKQV